MSKFNLTKESNFIPYFIGTIILKLSDKIYIIAIPWLVYDLTKSSFSMGTMFLIQTLPAIFISLIAGVVADRSSRKKLLIISSFLQGLIILCIPILNAIQLLNLWHIYVLGFIIASIGTFYSVVNSTVIPQLFSKEQLIKVNSTFQFIDTFSLLIGSALAGILINYIGVFNVFIVNSISFILISITILFLKLKNKQKRIENKSTSLEQLKEGVQYLLKHPALGPLTFLTLVVNIANGALISMLVYFARNQLYLTSEEIGWVYSASAISQILVIFIFANMSNRESTMKLMLTSLLISSIGIVIVAFSLDWVSLALGIAIQSAPVILFNLLNRTLRQKIVPTNIFGRVNGIVMMLSQSALPLSGFITGILADFFDIRYIFLILGLFSMIITFRFLLSPIKYYNEHNEVDK